MTSARGRPIVIAHRAASGYLPEHTLPGVVAAYLLGADYIEQDVVLTSDSIPIVLHDIYLDSTTDVATVFPARCRDDGRYYAMDFTLAEIKQLEVVERRQANGDAVFPDRFPVVNLGLRIPTLSEEINLIEGLNRTRQQSIGFYIELKAPRLHKAAGLDIAGVLLDVLARHGLHDKPDRVYLQCFDPDTLRRLAEQSLGLPLVQLIADNDWQETPGVDYDDMQTPQGLAQVAEYADGIGPWIPQLFSTDGLALSPLATHARALELAIHPYTLRADELLLGAPTFDALQARLFIDARVDGAFTDFVDLTRKFIDTHISQNGDQTP
ncbi:glycerophosphoryl diester phosphodiesterase [Luminiphilus syltensis NOR5-1B]|uniref:glycerophosphodiester phosphodiesterase n=1 Tax=Luminiphilus syltensis NOR5-1B TaxID=565045 RepID=B8KTP4_9GAMM|nr:glycerophosphodiester phosphodiesterase [Luminiphilus syltensis]EED36184.1 glycerophosphoryl diester phosphodiesterase [Luminiphilus syltensis NOR5-1B]